MKFATRWSVLALLCAAVLASEGTLAGCGGNSPEEAADVPPGAVAKVGDTVITKRGVNAFPLDDASDAHARNRVARFLVVADWVERDAQRAGVRVSRSAAAATIGPDQAKTAAILSSARSVLLLRALIKQATGPSPTAQQIDRYYGGHRDALPQRPGQARAAAGRALEAIRHDRANRIVRRRLYARYRPMTVCGQQMLLPQCSNGPTPTLSAEAFEL